MCHFTQFYNAAKETIEIYKDFMYNGTIRVSQNPNGRTVLPERSKNDHVYC